MLMDGDDDAKSSHAIKGLLGEGQRGHAFQWPYTHCQETFTGVTLVIYNFICLNGTFSDW